MVKYHRRLSTIINSVIGAGLDIRQVKEPTPTATSIEDRPELQNHQRRPALLLLSATGLLKQSIHIFMLVLIVQAVLSWVNPYSPISGVLDSLSRPFLIFFRRRIPLIGNVDISPLIVLILLQFILAVPVAWIDSLLYGMF